MADWPERLLAAANDRWHTRTGLLLAMVPVASSMILFFAGVDFGEISVVEWLVVGTGIAGVWLLWNRTRIPHVRRGMVGFGVAIACENDEPSQQAYRDLVLALRENLTAPQFRLKFHFLELRPQLAESLIDQDRAVRLALRANLHFLLYGRARLRNLPEGPAHVLDLKGIVRHAAIEKVRSQQFGQEFGASLPRRLILAADNTLIACEVAAKHIDTVAKYVIGTAAALSNDYAYAEQLLVDSEGRLTQLVEGVPDVPVAVLLSRVRGRLRDLYEAWLVRLTRSYTMRRNVDALRSAEEVIAKLRRYEPEHYGACLAAAMCAFLLRRDVVGAKQEIAACRGEEDATWRYSEAFLIAYGGDLDEAYRAYARAFGAPLNDATVPTQSEEFIQLVLDEEPHRPWLYYCMGLINYRAKSDLEAARKDLTAFIGSVDKNRFPRAVDSAEKWLREIVVLLPSVSRE